MGWTHVEDDAVTIGAGMTGMTIGMQEIATVIGKEIVDHGGVIMKTGQIGMMTPTTIPLWLRTMPVLQLPWCREVTIMPISMPIAITVVPIVIKALNALVTKNIPGKASPVVVKNGIL